MGVIAVNAFYDIFKTIHRDTSFFDVLEISLRGFCGRVKGIRLIFENRSASHLCFDAAVSYRINCFAIHAISAGLRHIRDIKSTRPLKQAWRSGILHIHVYIFENRSASQSTCFALMIFSINTHKKQMPHPKVWRLFFLWGVYIIPPIPRCGGTI